MLFAAAQSRRLVEFQAPAPNGTRLLKEGGRIHSRNKQKIAACVHQSARRGARQSGWARSMRRNGSWSLSGPGVLHLKRANIYATVHNPVKTYAALVIQRGRSEMRIAGINGRKS